MKRWLGLGALILLLAGFTAFLLREKLRENDECAEAEITEIPLSGKIQLGPF